MRVEPRLWVSLVLVLGTAQGAEAASALAECDAINANRITVGQCLDRKAAAVDAELSDAVKAVRERIAGLDTATGRQLATGAFDRSQRAFVRLRAAHCDWLATAVGAGTGSGDVARDCTIRMTQARAKELRAQLQGATSVAAPGPPPPRDGPAGLTGRLWRLTRLLCDGSPLALSAESAPSIEFDEAGHVSGNASINRFSGGYAIDASGALRWSEPGLATTRMAGPPELMRQEECFLDALHRAAHVHVVGDTLVLGNDVQTIVLTFEH